MAHPKEERVQETIENSHALKELGVEPTAMELIVPTYVHRYRRGGRLGRAPMA